MKKAVIEFGEKYHVIEIGEDVVFLHEKTREAGKMHDETGLEKWLDLFDRRYNRLSKWYARKALVLFNLTDCVIEFMQVNQEHIEKYGDISERINIVGYR